MVPRFSDAGCVNHQNPLLTSNSLSSMPKALPFVRVERFVDRSRMNHSETPESGTPATLNSRLFRATAALDNLTAPRPHLRSLGVAENVQLLAQSNHGHTVGTPHRAVNNPFPMPMKNCRLTTSQPAHRAAELGPCCVRILDPINNCIINHLK